MALLRTLPLRRRDEAVRVVRASAEAVRADDAVAAAVAGFLLHSHKPLARAAVVTLAPIHDALVPAETWLRARSRVRLRHPEPRIAPRADPSAIARWLDANRHQRRARRAAAFHRKCEPRVLHGLELEASLRLALEFSDPRLDAAMRLQPWREPAFRLDGEWRVGLSRLLGRDERTLLLNSVQMGRGCLRYLGGRENLLAVLRAFLVPYARRHGLTRIHGSEWFARLFGKTLPRASTFVRPAERELAYTDVWGPQFLVWKAPEVR